MKVRTIQPTGGVILSVLAVTVLLLRCNDVEKNPGPDDQVDKLHVLSRQFQCYMQIMTEVCQQNVAMERQLMLSHNTMTQDMSFIKQRLSGVTEFVQKKRRRKKQRRGVLYTGTQTGTQSCSVRSTPQECQN